MAGPSEDNGAHPHDRAHGNHQIQQQSVILSGMPGHCRQEQTHNGAPLHRFREQSETHFLVSELYGTTERRTWPPPTIESRSPKPPER
jgi:hypothetical protein